MNVLVACEESQAVCKAFREKGHNAYSCDIQECSGGHPEWHIQGDVIPVLNGRCTFYTMDNVCHYISDKWDLIIAHPPCTHLAVSGARHFEKKREDGRQREAVELFCKFLQADCERIVVENPVGIISGEYIKNYFPDLAKKYDLPRKHSQIIQPYEYGDPHKKTTCLWIKGLDLLKPTNIVEVSDFRNYVIKRGKNIGKTVRFSDWVNQCGKDRQKYRSKTFPGIAKAMADQWGNTRKKEQKEWQLSFFDEMEEEN